MCESRRVLVVDDSPVLRNLLLHVLAEEGYDVRAAVHGAHALERLVEGQPCVILLDLRMPVMDGRDFGRAYRARPDGDATIIVMTAEAATPDLAEVKPARVVAKPFDLDALLLLVRRYVDEHQAGQPATGYGRDEGR